MDSWNRMSKVPLHVIDVPADKKFQIVNYRRFFLHFYRIRNTTCDNHKRFFAVHCSNYESLKLSLPEFSSDTTVITISKHELWFFWIYIVNHAPMSDISVEISSFLHVSRPISNITHLVPFLNCL